MSIKIKTVEVSDGDKSYRIIEGIQALAGHELPKEYTVGDGLCCFLVSKDVKTPYLLIHRSPWSYRWVYLGSEIDEDEFQKLLEEIHKCGERLADINKRRKEQQVKHETFVI